MILALDVATKVGAAWGNIGAQPDYTTIDFTSKNGTGEVLAKWRFWLVAKVTALAPRVVVMEAPYIPIPRQQFVRAGTDPTKGKGPPPMNPAVLRRLLAMVGLVEEICFERAIPCREVTTGEVTKFFTGKARFPGGREAKKQAVLKMCRLYGWEPRDDNAGDALAIWCCAENTYAPQVASARGAMLRQELPLFGVDAASVAAEPVRARIGRRVAS